MSLVKTLEALLSSFETRIISICEGRGCGIPAPTRHDNLAVVRIRTFAVTAVSEVRGVFVCFEKNPRAARKNEKWDLDKVGRRDRKTEKESERELCTQINPGGSGLRC